MCTHSTNLIQLRDIDRLLFKANWHGFIGRDLYFFIHLVVFPADSLREQHLNVTKNLYIIQTQIALSIIRISQYFWTFCVKCVQTMSHIFSTADKTTWQKCFFKNIKQNKIIICFLKYRCDLMEIFPRLPLKSTEWQIATRDVKNIHFWQNFSRHCEFGSRADDWEPLEKLTTLWAATVRD